MRKVKEWMQSARVSDHVNLSVLQISLLIIHLNAAIMSLSKRFGTVNNYDSVAVILFDLKLPISVYHQSPISTQPFILPW